MRMPVVLATITLVVLSLIASNTSSAKRLVAPIPFEQRSVIGQNAVHFSSEYTPLSNKCPSGMTKKQEKEAEERGTDLPTRCKGLGGYVVDISYSACSSDLSLEKGEERIPLAMQAGDWKQKTVEWRKAQIGSIARPFAVIMRVYEYSGDDQCATGGKITGESLIVRGLKGYEHIDEEVKVKGTPNPNAKAREIADKGYLTKP